MTNIVIMLAVGQVYEALQMFLYVFKDVIIEAFEGYFENTCKCL